MKYYWECNTFCVAVINILKYKCVIWNRFPKSSHILSSPVDQSTVEDGNDVAFIEVLDCSPPT